ncbi:solute symporter family protein [Deinococcus radiodurans]|jgi:SSS sodium solute transporter superfamily|uniref:Sodium:solute symporter protein n=3 Tax=Bacteria TaxID=2 RepID=Q9RX38_DEIRA|nr:cation acetate symporter [Deinococcus radiodurans]AAF10057.1 sodium:solute symporter protein [Deinococcus radiodurans R1 = ATCC 13939 = DSM 20539]ANC72274.1 cation acetate symporter [Deinococcus radiodurans R1 = ATCC 13939 = DSM 20539]QEM72428.1 cation acetate symporter [Deinococcus radiodurans]HCE65500.1 cation acetate symporter [Deinococcus radiodurans]
MTFLLAALIVLITLGVTFWASSRNTSAGDFYVAGGKISATQNGIAIAGDYMSAASFLGITGLIALNGYDGFMYSVGWFIAYLTVLFIVAEPLRNLGKYTLADMLVYRLKDQRVRFYAAFSTITVSTFYMIAQVVGAGSLISLLSGGLLKPTLAIPLVGLLMIVYVVVGGMLATTWVQIIKAMLLMFATIVMSVLILARFGFSFSDLLGAATDKNGAAFLEPGLKYKNPLDLISLCLALVLGTAGLPHILVRFFTVPTAQDARKSVVVAMGLIGAFYIMTALMGNAANVLVGKDTIVAANPAGNMAAPLLAQALGGGAGTLGGEFGLAFVTAVAFATILAVVAGLTISASTSFTHDIYNGVMKGGKANEQEQFKVARMATVAVGLLSIVLGLLAKDQNVAFLVALAFAIAASANLPVILYTLFWRGFNANGAVWGIVGGLAVTLVLIALSPNIMSVDPPEKTTGRHPVQRTAIFPLENPGIVSIPAGFALAALGALLGKRRPEDERNFEEMQYRAYTGAGMDGTVAAHD